MSGWPIPNGALRALRKLLVRVPRHHEQSNGQLTPAQRRWLARRAAEAELPPVFSGIQLTSRRIIPNPDGNTVSFEPVEAPETP